LAGMLLPALTYAQNTDSSVRGKFITTAPRLGGITVTDLVTPVKANGNVFTMQAPVVDIGIPLYKDLSPEHATVVKTGIRYEGLFLSNEKNIGGSSFHSLTVPLLYSYSLTRTTSLSLIGLATVASDFKRTIEGEDIQYMAGVRVGFRPGKTLRWGITLTYVSNYSGRFLLPIPDIDWTISPKWSLTGVVPARASLKYALSRTQSLGATVGFTGSMYRLNDGERGQYLHFRQNSGGLLYERRLGQRWKFTLLAGHTFMQRLGTFNIGQKVSFDRFDKLNDRVPNVSYRQNSFVFQGGLSWQF